MGRVIANISISLDGYIAGPNGGAGNPLGDGGERLHEWIFGLKGWRERHGLEGGEDNPDSEVVDEAYGNIGAVVMGRRMFDEGEEPWGDEPPFHAPVFVLTHHARDPLPKEGTTYLFVTDGVDKALSQARAAAGDRDVSIAGGADVIQQCIRAGSLDELEIHVVPLLLGDGVRLFEHLDPARTILELARAVHASPNVIHIKLHPVR